MLHSVTVRCSCLGVQRIMGVSNCIPIPANHRRRRRGQEGNCPLPHPKIRAKTIFFGQKSCKIREFC